MDSDVVHRNTESLERLRMLAGSLTPEQLDREIDPPWTASALLAHTAFWDRFTDQRWSAAHAAGLEAPASIPEEALERINLAALHQWLLLPPERAVQECLAAATEINERIAALPLNIVEAVRRSSRTRLVDRSLHRSDHLETIEAAFGA